MRKRRAAKVSAVILAAAMLVGCGEEKPADNTEVSTEVMESTDAQVPGTEETKEEAIPEYEGYTLLWNDEFDGDAMDESIWSYDPHEPGWTNNELQEYTESTDNVFVRDGKMVLKAIKTNKDGADYYTSGKIKKPGCINKIYFVIVVFKLENGC